MYPVAYDQQPPEERNRLTLFFRYFTAIPHFIVLAFLGIAVFFTLIAAWFAVVVTGRYPVGLYTFHAGVTRWITRVQAYFHCVVDAYPPFSLDDDPSYPVRVGFAPPRAEYNRLKAAFRLILAIPVALVLYVMQLWLGAVAIALWIVGVFTGRTSAGLTEAVRIPLAYYARATAYLYLLTEDWPPFDPGRGELTAPPQPAGLST
jgi:hypothetical protein